MLCVSTVLLYECSVSQTLPNWSATIRGGNSGAANIDNYYAVGMSYGAVSTYNGTRACSLSMSKTSGSGVMGVHISPSYQNSTYKDNASVTPLSRECLYFIKYL